MFLLAALLSLVSAYAGYYDPLAPRSYAGDVLSSKAISDAYRISAPLSSRSSYYSSSSSSSRASSPFDPLMRESAFGRTPYVPPVLRY